MRINPYLYFNGNCAEAIKRYAEILGGEIIAMMRFEEMPDGGNVDAQYAKWVGHTRVAIGEDLLMASDIPPDRFSPMQGASVTLNIPEPEEAERVYGALIEGGDAIMPLTETFWALKFGVLVDRFGTQWMINCVKPED